MKATILAALAALALPAAAQQDTKPVEPRTQAVGAPASAKTADKSVTPRENARIAKAQNKETRCATGKEKQTRQKKAAAT